MTGRSRSRPPRAVIQMDRRIGGQGEADLERQLGEFGRADPGAGQRLQPGPAATDQRPIVRGEDIEAELAPA